MALHLVAAATNADRDIKSASIAVLTETPAASGIFQGLIKFGDGVKNLSATGGAFQLVITVGGQTIQPSPQTITFSTAVRAAVWTTPFPVVGGDEVVIKVLSPNAADSDVDVTAYLYDLTYGLPDAVAGAANGLFIAGTNAAVTVTGATTLASASVTGQFDAGNVLVDGTTVLTGATTQTGNLTITGTTTYTGAVTHKEDELYEKKLTITGATALTGAVTAPAGITANITGDITGTLATVTALTTKTGFALSATGADLILKNATFVLAIADAVKEEVSALGGAYTYDLLLTRCYQMLNNLMTATEATGVISLKAIGGASEIAAGEVNSAAGVTDRHELVWA
jgi:hypothetical protein